LRRAAALAILALLVAPVSHGQVRTLRVTDDGVGGITARTPYTPEAVSAALGGLPVKATKIYFDNIAVPALEAMRDGKRVLLAFRHPAGTRVIRAVVFAPDGETSTGVEIGMLMSRIYDHLPNLQCRDGLDQESDLVFCPAPGLGNVRFAFRCNYSTHDNSLPPASVLARCPLARITWIADE